MRAKEEEQSTDNSTVWQRLYKKLHAGCPLCRWHRNENASRKPTHGVKKKKSHRDK